MADFPSETYKGPNISHIKFRETYGYLNALYYLVISCQSQLEKKLNDDLASDGVAFGVVTHPISTTQFQVVTVHKEDARELAQDFGGFIATFQKQTIVSAYRLLVTYLADFLLELLDYKLIEIPPDQVRRLNEGFISSRVLGELYDRIDIQIARNDHEHIQFSTLVATRNVIEHNDCKVNEEYLRLTNADLCKDDNVPAGSKEAGEALAIAEWLSDSVNQRGLKKWPVLAK